MGNCLLQYRATIGLFNRSSFTSVTKRGLANLVSLVILLLLLLMFESCISSNYCCIPVFVVVNVMVMMSTEFRKNMSLIFYLKKGQSFMKRHDSGMKLLCTVMTLVLLSVESLCDYYSTRLILLSWDIHLNPGPVDLSIAHLNIRGLSTAKMLAIKHDIQSKFHVITLSETFLSQNSVHDLCLNGYHDIIRKDRDTFGGGVAVYLCNSLAYKRRDDLELNNIECIWLEVKQKTYRFLLATLYRPPNTDPNFWNDLQTMYDNAISNSPLPIIMTGDLNADPSTRDGIILKEFADSNFLTIHVNEPTRITETSSTILDQFLSNVPNLVKSVQIDPPLATNDHCTISMIINLKVHTPANYIRHIWNYKNGDLKGLNEAISSYDWEHCFQGDDIDMVLDRWTTSFLNLARQYIPNRVITVRSRDDPWFSGELRKLRQEKNRLHRIAKTINNPINWNNFRQARNTYVGKLREAETRYKENLATKLKDSRNINPKQWWHLTKQFLNKSNNIDIPPINDPTSNRTLFK